MRVRDAMGMLAASAVGELGPTTWADLGCGDGTFTRALAELLAPGSVIHAMDRDAGAVAHIPAHHGGARIVTYGGDFTRQPWPFAASHAGRGGGGGQRAHAADAESAALLDGILMANSLHYVREQVAFLRLCAGHLRPPHRMLVVEYDHDRPNAWVPFPISRRTLARLCGEAGYDTITPLGTRPSVYQRGSLYAALIGVSSGVSSQAAGRPIRPI